MSRAGRWAGLLLAALALLAGCAGQPAVSAQSTAQPAAGDWASLAPIGELELTHATQYTVQEYPQGLRLITIAGEARYLLVPQDGAAPQGLPQDVAVLQQPLDHIYLAGTAVMDFFRSVDGLGAIALSGTQAEGWYIPEARQAMEQGEILFAGKYSAPDYECILENDCDLAIESTMIYRSPEVKEQLERLGIPVLVDHSSYESDPLGRMEWVKLYGLLLGGAHEAAAQQAFDTVTQQLDQVQQALSDRQEPEEPKTVAFFYVTSRGLFNVRKPGDYIAVLLELAGGHYLPDTLPGAQENALSTMNLDQESFYAAAKQADVLIYNSTVDGELQSLEQLLQKCGLLADFKAVQTGNVWCTGQNLYQESMGLGDALLDFYAVLNGEDTQALHYLYRLE